MKILAFLFATLILFPLIAIGLAIPVLNLFVARWLGRLYE